MSVASVQKKVDGLEKERAEVVQKVADLEQRKQKAKTGTLAGLASQIAELRRVVPIIDQRLEGARTELAEQQQAEKRAAIEKLWSVEKQQMEVVVSQSAELKAALEELGETRNQIVRLKGMCKSRLAPGLHNALAVSEAGWRIYGWWADDRPPRYTEEQLEWERKETERRRKEYKKRLKERTHTRYR
jgi:hypothetical protein